MSSGPRDLDRREELRRNLRQRDQFRFVDYDEFAALIVSPRQLERFDDGQADLRGVRDPQSGQCFVIECEKIVQDFLSRAQPGDGDTHARN
ncbi:MAG: hypothetical protein AAF368_02675 [Planctomycetota bacterium]